MHNYESRIGSVGKGDSMRSEAVRTIARGEDILDQAKAVAQAIDERIHDVIGMTEDGSDPDIHLETGVGTQGAFGGVKSAR
jgi:hypothetical protein